MNMMNRTQAAANYVRALFEQSDRGVYECGNHIIIYGNDGYAKNRQTQKYVERMRSILNYYQLNDCEFGLSDDGHAWVLLVTPEENHIVDPEDLNSDLWKCWAEGITTDTDDFKDM